MDRALRFVEQGEDHAVALRVPAHDPGGLARGGDGVAVDRRHHRAGLDPGLRGGAVLGHLLDQRAARGEQAARATPRRRVIAANSSPE